MSNSSDVIFLTEAAKKILDETDLNSLISQQHNQPIASWKVIYDAPNTDVTPVPKLLEPECCCGCNHCTITTASITMAIINIFLAYCAYSNSPAGTSSTAIFLFGAVGLCYAGIAFCRSASLCYVVSAINHVISTLVYLFAIFYFLSAITVTDFEFQSGNGVAKYSLKLSIVLTLYGMLLTYMGIKFQEFGEYLDTNDELNENHDINDEESKPARSQKIINESKIDDPNTTNIEQIRSFDVHVMDKVHGTTRIKEKANSHESINIDGLVDANKTVEEINDHIISLFKGQHLKKK